MMKQNCQRPQSKRRERLALALRRRRAEYGKLPMTQRELSLLARVPVATISKLERRRTLPKSLAAFHRLALALEVPIEALFAPELREDERRALEARRWRGKGPR